MKKTKAQKGITLVALIITIVVLLILPAVAIKAVQGDGIISKAKEAQTKTKEAQEIEKIQLIAESVKLKSGILDEENLKSELNKELGEDGYNLYEDNSNYQLEIKESGIYYTIFSDFKVERREWIRYAENNVLKVKRGDLVIELGDNIEYKQTDFKDVEKCITNYTSLSTKNGSADQNFNIDESVTWKVLDVDEKGNLKIISSEIKTESGEDFYLKGRTAYCNAVDELNTICQLYGQGYGANSVRSVNYNDISKLDGYDASKDTEKIGTNKEDGIYFTFYWENNALCYKTNTGLTGHALTFGTFYYYDEKSKEWKESVKQKDYTEIVTIKNYMKYHNVGSVSPYVYWNNKAYQMIVVPSGDGYYLADVGGVFNAGTSIFVFGIGTVDWMCNRPEHIFVSTRDGEAERHKKIRAVVTLEKNVQLTKNSDGIWEFVK